MSFKALFFSIFVVSVSFVPFAKAGTSSFTYNDDLVCSYPFEQFVIDSLTCAPTSYIKFQTGNEYRDYAEDFSTCSFGDEMDISGRVTIEQAVARKYFLTLQACFQYSDSWYGSRKCSSFRVPLDLVAAVESTNNNGGQSSENYVSYLEAGNYAWSARLLLPKKTMSFGSSKFS